MTAQEELLKKSSEGAVVFGTFFKRNYCVQWCICGRNTSDASPQHRPQITVIVVTSTPDEARNGAHCAEGLFRVSSEGVENFGPFIMVRTAPR
jgi:hypothetical protein